MGEDLGWTGDGRRGEGIGCSRIVLRHARRPQARCGSGIGSVKEGLEENGEEEEKGRREN